MTAPISVYAVLSSGKMVEVPWQDEYGHDDFGPEDAVDQVKQKLRTGETLYGRLITEEGPDETFRFIAIEPRAVEMVFANA